MKIVNHDKNHLTIDGFINSKHPIQRELLLLLNRTESLTIFDIGACEAEDSIRYSNLFTNATVYSFEPLPENMVRCINNIERFNKKGKVVFVGLALSNQSGVRTLYVSSGSPLTLSSQTWDYGNKSSSLLNPNLSNNPYEWLEFNKTVEVQTETLNNICTKYKINTIDFAHIDVQGAELEVLKGAGESLKKIKIIWLEVENTELYSNQPLKKDVEDFMRINGFYKLIDTVNNVSGDQLYVNNLFFFPHNTKVMCVRVLTKMRKLYGFWRKLRLTL
jgi:FkbM family methyltransferase